MKIIDHGQQSLERLLLPGSILDEIEQYCRAEPSLERCGLIGGRGELACTFYPMKNIAEDAAHNYFVDPHDQLDAFRAMRTNQQELLGIVHSHPSSVAEPSPTDANLAAYPGIAYLIVSLLNKESTYGCYLYEQRTFTKLPLEIVTDTLSAEEG